MFKITGKKLSLESQIKLSPKQLRRLHNLDCERAKTDYVLSILGRRERVHHTKSSQGTDKLANKRSGAVLRRLEERLVNDAHANHTPMVRSKNSQWVGVEIECYIKDFNTDDDEHCEYCEGSGTAACSNCEGNGYLYLRDDNGNEYEVVCGQCNGDGHHECGECDGLSSSNSSDLSSLRDQLKKAQVANCSVRTDGSLSSGGLEVCILFDASKGFKKLEKLCKVLADNGATVDSSCGLHVHLDYHGFSKTQVLAIGRHFEKFLPVLSQLVPASRRSNNYCKLKACDSDRYSAINLTAFSKHKTIEVRLHSGTTSFEKIKNWVELLICIKNRYDRKRPFTGVNNFQRFMDVLALPPHLTAYYDKRLQKFNPQTGADISAAA